jgi:dTDP-glucose 4,6-dehydratase
MLIVSTDEVYGSINNGKVDEKASINPSSAYSASKASADLIGRSYFVTHGVDVRITRSANNYGKYQNKEKFIPTVISKIKSNQEIPVYGNGLNIREWIHTDDHCFAIHSVLQNGKPGEIYNISGGEAYSNLELIKIISDKLGRGHNLVRFIPDRLGHDFRYAVNDQKIISELGWSRTKNLVDSLDEIFDHELD